MSYGNNYSQSQSVWPPWGYNVDQSDLKSEHMERNASSDSGYGSHLFPGIKQESADTYMDGGYANYDMYGGGVDYTVRSPNVGNNYGGRGTHASSGYNTIDYASSRTANLDAITSPLSPSVSMASWSSMDDTMVYSPDVEANNYSTGAMFPQTAAPPPPAPSTLHRQSTSSSSSSKRTTSGKEKQYVCLSPGCAQKAFARSADLDRHYKQVHKQSTEKEHFACDYRRCPRAGGEAASFGRKDHFRDHLRDFHREDLPKRGGGSSSSAGDDLARRNIDIRWWRCTKCLQRIYVDRQGWECPDCKMVCERDRRLARCRPLPRGSET